MTQRVTGYEDVEAALTTPKSRRTSKPSNSKRADATVFNFNTYVREARQKYIVELLPKSEKQQQYVDLLLDDEKKIVLASGPAGTGKTMLAVLAAIKAYREQKIDRIVITRPAVGVDDEKHGFLPGSLNEKMEPWTKPIFDVFKEHYKPKDIAQMLEEEIIEITPLAYMRGRTFKRAFIIADEMQNTSVNQMKMLLTRLGEGSKMVLTGDLNQIDRQFIKENGLSDFLDILRCRYSSDISAISFDNVDIQRHEVVKEILEFYGEI